jgi:hypothetical protein
MFIAYTLLLMFSGVLLIVVGAAVGGQSARARVLSIVVGVAFFGYGFYLAFLFPGGHYILLYYAFVAPIALIVRTVQARRASKARAMAPQAGYGYPAAPGYPTQAQGGYPAPQAQPGYPASYAQPGYPAAPGYPAPQGQGGYPTPQAQPGYVAPQAQPAYPTPQVQAGYPAQQVPADYPAPQVRTGYPPAG